MKARKCKCGGPLMDTRESFEMLALADKRAESMPAEYRAGYRATYVVIYAANVRGECVVCVAKRTGLIAELVANQDQEAA